MDALTTTLVGFTVGGLIFSFFLRREKIKTVAIVLTAMWAIIAFVQLKLYLDIVNPQPPQGLTISTGLASLLLIIILVTEFLGKKE